MFLFLSFSKKIISTIAIQNPTIQITVPSKVIFEFIKPVKPFITAKIIKHITNSNLDIIV